MLFMEQSIEQKINAIIQVLDALAIAVKEGFEQVDKRFEQVDKRFSEVESQLRAVKQDVESIRLRQDNVAYRFELNELQQRVMRLEDSVLKR